MANNTLESARGGREPATDAKDAEEGAADAAVTDQPKPSGGFKPWLPLVVALVAMPVLAYATTRFVLLPKLQRALALPASAATPESAPDTSASAGGESGKNAPAKTKVMVPLSKMLVNVAGTM